MTPAEAWRAYREHRTGCEHCDAGNCPTGDELWAAYVATGNQR